MEQGEINGILHRVFIDCNDGVNSSQLAEQQDSFIASLQCLSSSTIETISWLTNSESPKSLRDEVAEVVIVFLLNGAKRGAPTTWSTTVLSAELCVAEMLHRVMSAMDLGFSTGDMWLALINYEANEKVEPFTTNYLLSGESIRQRYIVYACLDAVFSGQDIPEEVITFSVENIASLTDICRVVHARQTFSVDVIAETLTTPSRSLSLGVL